MSVYIRQNANDTSFDMVSSWLVLSDIENRIKRKIETIGVPLKEWNIRINYGIKTGFNEAFIINKKQRDDLIILDPKSKEIIRPILRGRDIKRYGYDFGDLWLINLHNGIKESGLPPVEINSYPAIKKHLDQYYTSLEKRSDKGDTPYNLRNCAYMEDFNRQKIVWGNLNMRATYAIAEPGIFINAPSPIIVPANKYLLAILNSKLADYYVRSLGVTRNGGYFEYKPMFVEKLPVPQLTDDLQSKFITLADETIQAIKQNRKTTKIEAEIDRLVYELYELDKDEINFIERLIE